MTTDVQARARMLLAARGYDVVGEAFCAASALDAVERHAPQAVLLDVRLGDDDGFELCGLLTRFHPELAVLLTSAEEHNPELITRCGASGFVQKHRLLQTDFAQFWTRRPSSFAGHIPPRTAALGARADAVIPSPEPNGTSASEQLVVEARRRRRTALVALRGELDLVTVSKVAEVLDELQPKADGVRHVVLDLRGLTFMDLPGLHELIRQNEYARSNRHNLAVVRGTPLVQRVLELTVVETSRPRGRPR